ncbi:hypothetical protein [Micromonospora sp. NBC_01813]|jgi:hypothetical protein|uniref:hypothetical protein n=1 Tax=Micromonospora sp. NBC_01813 TaxID=2975988 RepID=UPI002DDB1F40|nr:hypothetical protein [Micromonospora sp. NBC_01813]WSA08371.1 hypothetical protein OG958_29990 [Micromonospora sp. NBC_01813]
MLDAVHVLAASQDLAANNFGDTRTGGLAGPMGLFLILLLAAATVLLIRNMNVRLRRLPSRFEHGPAEDAPSPAERNVLDPTEPDVRPGSPL